MSNDSSTDVQYIQTINRSPGLQYKQWYIPGIEINSYNLYTICNKMSNDISSTNVQYIQTVGGKKCQQQKEVLE